MFAVESKRSDRAPRRRSRDGESHYVLGYELEGLTALVSHLQSNLERLGLCDATEVFQVSTALGEAFANAIDHGNLDLDSSMREEGIDVYEKMRQERAQVQPYRDRRVQVIESVGRNRVTYVVRDEGRGFDVSTVPDPTDAQNLLKASGRGLMLIRTFMDDVKFNGTGNEITMVKRRSAA
jgi:anti-sigma regulatory factor (Ser/Thr protein kinase)